VLSTQAESKPKASKQETSRKQAKASSNKQAIPKQTSKQASKHVL
jgi:hypothetical protein